MVMDFEKIADKTDQAIKDFKKRKPKDGIIGDHK